jgi:hypothetical protein
LYLAFSQKLLATTKQTFLVEKKGKEDMMLVNVRTSSQMEDKKNQLVLSQSKLDLLFLALEKEQIKANPNVSRGKAKKLLVFKH